MSGSGRGPLGSFSGMDLDHIHSLEKSGKKLSRIEQEAVVPKVNAALTTPRKENRYLTEAVLHFLSGLVDGLDDFYFYHVKSIVQNTAYFTVIFIYYEQVLFKII